MPLMRHTPSKNHVSLLRFIELMSFHERTRPMMLQNSLSWIADANLANVTPTVARTSHKGVAASGCLAVGNALNASSCTGSFGYCERTVGRERCAATDRMFPTVDRTRVDRRHWQTVIYKGNDVGGSYHMRTQHARAQVCCLSLKNVRL